jgi:hypothetical protein
MAKLFYDLLLLGVAIQLSCYLLFQFNFFGGLISYPLGSISQLYGSGSIFSITVYGAIIGGAGAVAILVVGLLTRAGVYAIFALLIWAIGCIVTYIYPFFIAIPNTIGAFIDTTGLPSTITNTFVIFLTVIFLMAGFWYLFGLVIQRPPEG